MTARFMPEPAKTMTTPHSVVDRKSGNVVAYCNNLQWAKMIADGLNWVVDQVTPWSPSSAYADVLGDQGVRQDVVHEQDANGTTMRTTTTTKIVRR